MVENEPSVRDVQKQIADLIKQINWLRSNPQISENQLLELRQKLTEAHNSLQVSK